MGSFVGFLTFFFFLHGGLIYFLMIFLAYYYNKYLFYFLVVFAIWHNIIRKPHKRFNKKSEIKVPRVERRWFFRMLLDGVIRYFDTELHAEPEIVDELKEYADSGKKFIFANHPHGTMGFGSNVLMCGSKPFERLGLKKIKLLKLAASVLMKIPITRDLAYSLGIISADRSVAMNALKSRDYSIVSVLGGEYEQLLGQKDPDTVYVKRRRGFIRLALEHGNCVIVPTYNFGETETYYTFGCLMPLRMWVAKKFRVALICQWGQWLLPLMPKSVKMDVVIGQPIVVEESDEEEDIVGKYHDLYCQELDNVFEKYKERFGYRGRKLKFV